MSPWLSLWLVSRELVWFWVIKCSLREYDFHFPWTLHQITDPPVPSLSTPLSGAGPIGLITLLAARAAGAEPIVISDLFQSRLDVAKQLVPGVRTVLVERSDSPEDVAAKVIKAAGGKVRIAMECSGVESSIRGAIYVSSNACAGMS